MTVSTICKISLTGCIGQRHNVKGICFCFTFTSEKRNSMEKKDESLPFKKKKKGKEIKSCLNYIPSSQTPNEATLPFPNTRHPLTPKGCIILLSIACWFPWGRTLKALETYSFHCNVRWELAT